MREGQEEHIWVTECISSETRSWDSFAVVHKTIFSTIDVLSVFGPCSMSTSTGSTQVISV
jgi:hypothetical protein